MTVVREIQAKVLLSHIKQPDPWFGLKYNMNLYRGCQHRCIYCDSRSECYGVDHFDSEIHVKANAIERLRDELSRKRVKGLIGTGSMNDPYMPLERTRMLTGAALEVIAEFGFPVHVLTKSDLVLRDVARFQAIQRRTRAVVSFTITTADDDLAARIEPYAPRPSARFEALRKLAAAGIETGVMLMPVLPFIEDSEENVTAVVERAVDSGAHHVVAFFGLTMRDRQRAYFYAQLDRHFPGLRRRYERTYGDRYGCDSPGAENLYALFESLKTRHGFADRVRPYQAVEAEQLSLF
jgi:DNA repair photolyase